MFAGGEIVPGLQVLDAVQNETVERGHSASYYYVGMDAAFAFDTAIPFGQLAAKKSHGRADRANESTLSARRDPGLVGR